MNSKIIFFILILVAVILEIIANILFKEWPIKSKKIILIIGLLLYFTGTVFWAISLKYEFLSKAISIFTIFNLVIITLVGVLFFQENLTLTNKIGITLGIISLILISKSPSSFTAP